MPYNQSSLLSAGSTKLHIDFHDDFNKALDLMENTSKNVFVTGRAGTGKSTLIEHFRNSTNKSIAVLAPTGVAALNVKGQTIHSFFKFKPDVTPESVRLLYPNMRKMYASLDAIVIDEISMVRADLLDCIDSFMRRNGKNAALPFGGVQMIFIGDLYQLPPVVTQGEVEMFKGHYKSEYFFDSHSFNSIAISFVELKKHYRQTDAHFIGLLNSIRDNTASDAQLLEINSRVNVSFTPKASDKYISLTTTNHLAEDINSAQMEKLAGRTYTYRAKSESEFEKRAMPAQELLSIKIGAQVMMLNNDKGGRWVNGSLGVVVSINSKMIGQDLILVELADGSIVEVAPFTWELFKFSYDPTRRKLEPKIAGKFVQYPMMLAWAITIHKSQGKTFDHVIIDIGYGTFAYGQLYVALSRCTSLEGIVLRRKIERKHILMDPRIVDFLRNIEHNLQKAY